MLPAGTSIRSVGTTAFAFPDVIPVPADIVAVDDEAWLARRFPGWRAGDLRTGRAPLVAVCQDGHPVSICCCARSADAAAEAGVETAEAYRGRGYAARATSGWALAVRASGRIPLYSTHWTNRASLALAARLGVQAYASGWNVSA
jgi:RimJ/RimL family protein N-acetyltransferase